MINIMKKMQQFGRRGKRGLTLVEVLVVMGLLGGFLVVLTTVFTTTLKVQTESDSTASVAQDGRFLLARLSYDILRADTITTPASLGASSSSLVLTISGTTYTYAVASGVLQLTTTETNALNSSETTVSGFTLQRIGNSGGKETIRLSFTLTSKTRSNSGFETKTYTSTVGRR